MNTTNTSLNVQLPSPASAMELESWCRRRPQPFSTPPPPPASRGSSFLQRMIPPLQLGTFQSENSLMRPAMVPPRALGRRQNRYTHTTQLENQCRESQRASVQHRASIRHSQGFHTHKGLVWGLSQGCGGLNQREREREIWRLLSQPLLGSLHAPNQGHTHTGASLPLI